VYSEQQGAEMNGYWIFDEYEDDWVYVPSAEELSE
jgi:hypothetical protein